MKIEIYPDASGEFRWRMKAANGETIADSGEGYKEARECHVAMRRVCSTGLLLSWRKLEDEQPEPFAEVLFYDSKAEAKVLGFHDGNGHRVYVGRVHADFAPDYFLPVMAPIPGTV